MSAVCWVGGLLFSDGFVFVLWRSVAGSFVLPVEEFRGFAVR